MGKALANRIFRQGIEVAGRMAMPENPELTENERLAKRVRKSAASRVPLAAQNIHVDTVQGTVTLSGHVRSYYHKQLWLNATQRVVGVERVVDKIEVAVNAPG